MDHLGLFGASGMTAYFGMFDIGGLKDGDNVVISGAAGSVGLVSIATPLPLSMLPFISRSDIPLTLIILPKSPGKS